MYGALLLIMSAWLTLALHTPALADENRLTPGKSDAWQSLALPPDFRLSWGGDVGAPGGLMLREIELPSAVGESDLREGITDKIRAYAGAGLERDPLLPKKNGMYDYNRELNLSGSYLGVGELGLTFKPSTDSGFSMNLNTKGYAGKRDGMAGNFQLKWEF